MYTYYAIASSLIALLFALVTGISIKKADAGNEKMKTIAKHIADGAMAFIKKEYSIIFIFMVALAILLGVLLSLKTAICFVIGATCSMLAGFFGMKIATKANVRTANAAKQGLAPALKLAFSGGSVMGLSVVGLGLLGLSICWLLFGNSSNTDSALIITGYSLGASFIALFSRVGGGIYTKAADVGADLVGKVEAGIPEDDPRNPAVIADNVGDNVGDVAGMGADLFESYVGAIVSVITLAIMALQNDDGLCGKYILFAFSIVSAGVLASVLGTIFVKLFKKLSPQTALNGGGYISMLIFGIAAFFLSSSTFDGNLKPAIVVAVGLLAGAIIGKVTEIYTSADYRPVKQIAEHSTTGAATNIITGLSTGMLSTAIPIIIICIAILIADLIDPNMGIGLVAVGMLATTGMTVAVDAYGPIADNAGGIAEMAGLDKVVRERTDSLDSVGNTTAAIGKGFAIGSAALTALALFKSYAQAAGIKDNIINLTNTNTVIGLLIGAMLPFLFSALTINAVSRAANAMITEIRRQFKEIKGLLEGKAEPDYVTCVDISTGAALKNMIFPALIAIVVPIAVGLFDPQALGGLLAGALASGVMMAIFMSNSGGAWDNAKKYIETGMHGGKGSDSHTASIIGDTVGDPLKDTAGPSINILIKLMSIVALVFLPLFK
ncbi:MAG: sodium-translocating pyrophosphatase [Bacillota bacterium]|nr:sodium-translocating pyrophosphatase [Bacillota bacterium]